MPADAVPSPTPWDEVVAKLWLVPPGNDGIPYAKIVNWEGMEPGSVSRILHPGWRQKTAFYLGFRVEAMGLEPTNLLTASQALYQLSYAPEG